MRETRPAFSSKRNRNHSFIVQTVSSFASSRARVAGGASAHPSKFKLSDVMCESHSLSLVRILRTTTAESSGWDANPPASSVAVAALDASTSTPPAAAAAAAVAYAFFSATATASTAAAASDDARGSGTGSGIDAISATEYSLLPKFVTALGPRYLSAALS